jgi:alkanesulfonate monooxygenase SsuD/methylene tetrahydromethanopterin reductase-like flavin-dependent oxidoreductase (luciferase family)
MKFHLIQPGTIGRRSDIEQGMAGQRTDLYQRYLEEIRGYVRLADELGFASYGHNEHHLQIEGFEVTNHPGMFSLYIGLHAKRMSVATLGYVLPTHNPVRAAEEIATLDQMLQGRLIVGFTRGYQSRWVGSYAAVPGVNATTPELAKSRDAVDNLNRDIFEESVKIVKTAWLNSTFSYEGKFWTFPPKGLTGHPVYAAFGAGQDEDGTINEIGIAPRPYQNPYPKLYGAFAHSMRTIDMWAREGGKPIVLANQLEFCQALWNRYIQTSAKHGRDVPREEAAAWGGVLILGDDSDHLAEIKADHDWSYDTFFKPFGQGQENFLIGNADEISRRIEEAQKLLGFNEIWLRFGQGHLPPEENEEQLYRFVNEVAPRFATKDEAGTWV